MSQSSFHNISVKCISAAVPIKTVDNFAEHTWVSEEEKTKTIKLTGIKQYRKADSFICTSDLCQKAAEILLERLHIEPESVDAVLFVSQTPDYRLPSTACVLQDKLRISQKAIAFDINLGCSGFVYGLYTACCFIQGGGLKRVLLLCGDTQTKFSCPGDKSVAFILGDAGTATLIEYQKGVPDINFLLMSDGSRFDRLIVPGGGYRNPSSAETLEMSRQPDGGMRSLEHVYMDGMEIFNFSVTDVVKTIQVFMDSINIDPSQIDFLVLHQANKFMTDKIARKLRFPSEKVLYSLQIYGNTSCASIPLTIVHNFQKIKEDRVRRCILAGFGVGLSWGVVDIAFDSVLCPPVAEL